MASDSNREAARGAKIQLRDLTKRFAGQAAVDGISLDVPAGSFVSLLGPSGSGKTTTLNLIAGFLSADAGDILFDDRSVAEVPPQHRDIGMVFQSYALFPISRSPTTWRFRCACARSLRRARCDSALPKRWPWSR